MFSFGLYHIVSFVSTSDCKFSSTHRFLFCVFPPLQTLWFYPWIWAKVIEVKIIGNWSCQLLHMTHTTSEIFFIMESFIFYSFFMPFLSLISLHRFSFSQFCLLSFKKFSSPFHHYCLVLVSIYIRSSFSHLGASLSPFPILLEVSTAKSA